MDDRPNANRDFAAHSNPKPQISSSSIHHSSFLSSPKDFQAASSSTCSSPSSISYPLGITGSHNNLPMTSLGAESIPPPKPNRPSTAPPFHPMTIKSGFQSTKLTDEELVRLGPRELIQRLRKAESEAVRVMIDHQSTMKDVNKRLQVHLLEIRALKNVNQRVQEEHQELRDLCCFLDDDRQKSCKLAREWQRFGRYTASVMRQEVSAYQAKLHDLESKQHELVRDNLELKEICLYLDEERSLTHRQQFCSRCGEPIMNNLHGPRDEGDGSSTSTTNEEGHLPSTSSSTGSQFSPAKTNLNSRDRVIEDNLQKQRSLINEQILSYIRSLEQRLQTVENSTGKPLTPNSSTSHFSESRHKAVDQEDESRICTVGVHKPDSVINALKVLEVQEDLDKSGQIGNIYDDNEALGNSEKALVREMCNVVWRKIGDGKNYQ